MWDSQAQDLHDPLGTRRLWSSSTASTRFDVTVLKSEASSDEMAEGSAGTSDRDLAEAGPSGINREVDRQPTALEVAEGLHSDTNLIASTVREPPWRPTPPPRVPTPVPRNVPTPVPRTSRPVTPTLNNVAGSRPATPALQLMPIAGLLPLAQPPQGDQPEMAIWAERVERAFQNADDTVLPYHGQRVRTGRADAIRAEAERLSRVLRDCYPTAKGTCRPRSRHTVRGWLRCASTSSKQALMPLARTPIR